MDARKTSLKILAKIAILSGLCLAIVAGIVWLSLVQGKAAVLEERKASIRHTVEMASEIAAHFYTAQQKGLLTEAQAQRQAADAIRAMKHTQGGYMFIMSTDRMMVVHGTLPAYEGRSIYDMQSSRDTTIAELLIATGQAGGGYFTYLFRRGDDPVLRYPKIAYAKPFTPWNWILGSSLYIDDLDAAFTAQMLDWVKIVLGPLLFLVFLALYLERTITRPILALDKARREAEVATRAKSDFLANMSHEIRTPLNSILGVSRLIAESAAKDEIRNWGTLIYNSGEALLALINDILDLSKIEAGNMKLSATPFDLCNAVREVTDLLILPSREKNIEIVVQFSGTMPPSCIGDVGRFKQILTNLIGNAVKFTREGYVAVRFRLRARAGGVWLMTTITDTGLGIPAEKQRYIFEKFAQAEESTTRTFGGAGIGLAITKSLIALMGGRIRLLWSAEGQGSCFGFIVPLETGTDKALTLKPPPNIDLRGLRVLIVDNLNVSALITQNFLENCGMLCDTATTLAAARDFLAIEPHDAPYDFVILDYRLDDGHALVFSREIKADPRHAKLQIVLMTAFGQFSSLDRLTQHGIDAFLIKPFYPPQFEAVLKILRDARTRSATLPLITRHTLVNLLGGLALPYATGHAQRFEGVKVLIVDDMPINRLLMSRILEQAGCTFSLAVNGREALQMLMQDTFDIVFMDCQMPEMDGYESTKALRQFEAAHGRHTPVVALTADAMTGDRERCLAAGMDDYLYKPFKPEQIAAMIRKWAVMA